MDKIDEKIKSNQHAHEILTDVNIIIDCLDYEIDKFRDVRSSVIFTENLNPASLFTMASHLKYADFTKGITNVVNKLKYLQNHYKINLENEIAAIFYIKFADPGIKFLENFNTNSAVQLRQLIISRSQVTSKVDFSKLSNVLSQEMHKLISELNSSTHKEIIEVIKIILQIDPIFKPLINNSAHVQALFEDLYHGNHIDFKELNIDFIDYTVNFFHRIYKQVFGKLESLTSSDEIKKP